MYKMRHEQSRMETMPKTCGRINYHKKEIISNTKKRLWWISKRQTPGITDTVDTTGTSTSEPDSQTKGIGNGNGRVINSTSRHRWQLQSGIESIFSPPIEIQTRREGFGQWGSTRITKQQRAPCHSLHWQVVCANRGNHKKSKVKEVAKGYRIEDYKSSNATFQ